MNQYSLEKRLLQEEQVILEQRDLILTNSELKMEALKDQQAGLQQARKDFAPTERFYGVRRRRSSHVTSINDCT